MLPRLVLADSPQAALVGELETRWLAEYGGERLAWDEAWIWEPAAGYALFERSHGHVPMPGLLDESTFGERRWTLHRIWIVPHRRRRGLVTAAWPLWRERYGAFRVTAPGAEMRAFLAKIERSQ